MSSRAGALAVGIPTIVLKEKAKSNSYMVVLLQAQAGEVEPTVVELAPKQIATLGNPPIVRLERMHVTGKKPAAGMRLLLEVAPNDALPEDGCRLAAATLKTLGVAAQECLRLTLVDALQRVGGHGPLPTAAEVDLEARWAELRKREGLVAQLQQTLAKLTHERGWYQQQAEQFRAQLEATSAELDLAMEERQVAVSMYAKARAIEEDLLHLKLRHFSDPVKSGE